MGSVKVSAEFLRPLPKALWDAPCATCDRRQSKWEVSLPETTAFTLCSLCFLYDSFWSEQRIKTITQFICDVEVQIGCMFVRDIDGKLVRCEDADRILGALVLSARLFDIQDRMAHVQKASDS